MIRDDRFYAFIVERTSRSRSRIRRISVHRRWLKASAYLGMIVFSAALYGLYGLVQQPARHQLERENNRLRTEAEQHREQLETLKNRVEAIDETARRLAEMSGVSSSQETGNLRGRGGPAVPTDSANITTVAHQAAQLERELRTVEMALRERARVPSIWPVEGELTDGFGARRDPFDDALYEFHAGQDVAAAWGTPVAAAGSGTVIFAGTQNGYGQVVIVDHSGGLTTRYGHLSKIETEAGQQVERGDEIGSVGSTGRSTGPHLHYEVRVGDQAVNPRRYLPPKIR